MQTTVVVAAGGIRSRSPRPAVLCRRVPVCSCVCSPVLSFSSSPVSRFPLPPACWSGRVAGGRWSAPPRPPRFCGCRCLAAVSALVPALFLAVGLRFVPALSRRMGGRTTRAEATRGNGLGGAATQRQLHPTVSAPVSADPHRSDTHSDDGGHDLLCRCIGGGWPRMRQSIRGAVCARVAVSIGQVRFSRVGPQRRSSAPAGRLCGCQLHGTSRQLGGLSRDLRSRCSASALLAVRGVDRTHHRRVLPPQVSPVLWKNGPLHRSRDAAASEHAHTSRHRDSGREGDAAEQSDVDASRRLDGEPHPKPLGTLRSGSDLGCAGRTMPTRAMQTETRSEPSSDTRGIKMQRRCILALQL